MRAVPIGWKASSRRSEGLNGRLEAGEVTGLQDSDPRDVGVDLGGAGGEVDLGGAGDPEGEAVGVPRGSACRRRGSALGAEPDPALGAVGEVDADRADVAEVEHRPLVARAGPGSQAPPKASGVKVASRRIPVGSH